MIISSARCNLHYSNGVVLETGKGSLVGLSGKRGQVGENGPQGLQLAAVCCPIPFALRGLGRLKVGIGGRHELLQRFRDGGGRAGRNVVAGG